MKKTFSILGLIACLSVPVAIFGWTFSDSDNRPYCDEMPQPRPVGVGYNCKPRKIYKKVSWADLEAKNENLKQQVENLKYENCKLKNFDTYECKQIKEDKELVQSIMNNVKKEVLDNE